MSPRAWSWPALPVVASSEVAVFPPIDPGDLGELPDFAATPTIQAVASGNWSSPLTWTPTRVPVAGDVVLIPAGITVTFDAAATGATVKTVGVHGTLQWADAAPTQFTVGTLLVYADGVLTIGTAANPQTNLTTILFSGTLETGTVQAPGPDPAQYGVGLLSVGKIRLHGQPVTNPFVRLSVEPLAGTLTVTTAESLTGWAQGDTVLLPDTRELTYAETHPYVSQVETRTIAALAGGQITLSAPLTYTHPGARDASALVGVLEYLPHVANLSRTIVFRSADPNGTRGHVLIHHHADFDARYVLWKDLGRTRNVDQLDSTTFDSNGNPTHIGTNQIGRYPPHLHHLDGPLPIPASGYQFVIQGTVVHGSTKWGLAIHDSHYGLVKENVVYDTPGFGIGTEDGSESFNVIEKNFVAHVSGRGGTVFTVPGSEPGTEGSCYWFRGPRNYIRNNVASGCWDNYGFTYSGRLVGIVQVPTAQGSHERVPLHSNATPILKFEDNEVTGSTRIGLTFWDIGAYGDQAVLATEDSIILNFTFWHVQHLGIFFYPSSRLIVDGLVGRGSVPGLYASAFEGAEGIFIGDYLTHQATIRNADLQGLKNGIYTHQLSGPRNTAGSTFRIENSYIRCITGVIVFSPYSVSGGGELPPKRTELHNIAYDSVEMGGDPHGRTQRTLYMGYMSDTLRSNLVVLDEVQVTDHDGVVGDNFRAYYVEQAAAYIMPQTSGLLIGSPVAGLTNQQNWDTYGIATAGKVAPCATTRADILGYVCAS